jgi:hypothetical protein
VRKSILIGTILATIILVTLSFISVVNAQSITTQQYTEKIKEEIHERTGSSSIPPWLEYLLSFISLIIGFIGFALLPYVLLIGGIFATLALFPLYIFAMILMEIFPPGPL